MQYFTTCFICKKLQQLATDDYGHPVEGIGCEVELELPGNVPLEQDELCLCEGL
jgi:hypothetical protein